MLIAGPSMTFVPLARCSTPMAYPNTRTASKSQPHATVIADGHAVTPANPPPTPWGPSADSQLFGVCTDTRLFSTIPNSYQLTLIGEMRKTKLGLRVDSSLPRAWGPHEPRTLG